MDISLLLAFTAKISRVYDAAIQPVLAEFGISRTSFDILTFLAHHPEHYTAKEISAMCSIKPNVVSLHVDRLVNAGYLERQSVSGDRRKIRLVCTGQVSPILERSRQVRCPFFARLMDGLTEQELETFKHCFQTIDKNADSLLCGAAAAGRAQEC